MDTTTPAIHTADPIALLRGIDSDAIRHQLAQMERDRRALLVLLRAACRLSAPDTTQAKVGCTNG